MKCIVTGGAGFIGSNLVDTLINRGDNVFVIDDLSTGKKEHINSKATFLQIDINDLNEKIILEKFGIPDVIFHLAGFSRIEPSFNLPQKTNQSNVDGTLNILEIIRKLNSNIRLIYAGSSSFYYDLYANPYAFTKWIGEEYCKLYTNIYGLSVAIARFFNVYGPRQMETGDFSTLVGIFQRQKSNNQKLTITGDGNQRRDFTHVFDIVSGLIAMSDKDWHGEIFNLGTGINYSINEVAKMFEPCEIEYIPKRKGEAETTLADISFSSKNLSWKPLIRLDDYVKKFLK
jgi:UDP-glucose 4-epimerase